MENSGTAYNEHRFTNQLIHESSPYLLQHAHNPVNWYPWGDAALEKAKKEKKPLIISIGYAACHWCHVMEHESFEDTSVAELMNEQFVAIKVDREERPDIDQVYMNALQLLAGSGGWPLNVIALPDGRPLYGGTYFPKEQWISVLQQVSDFIKRNPGKAEEQAESLSRGVRGSEIIHENPVNAGFTMYDLQSVFSDWKNYIDFEEGGLKGAPKFPMPAGWQFLLQYHFLTGDADALKAVITTLDKMAGGGIYDQAGGGFARYSTDAAWKVPHFEKMLYDNAQLVSLYATAFQATKDEGYKAIVYETLEFAGRELTSPDGAFYSSLDADSEGEEGRFYLWKYDELRKALGADAGLVSEYFNVTEDGNRENGNNILFRSAPDKSIAEKYNLSKTELEKKISVAKKILLRERSKRIRPSCDDKILTAWHAMMLKGYVDAYRVFDEPAFLNAALKNAEFILKHLKKPDYRLERKFRNGKSSINGFLDDYAFTIDAFIGLYQAAFDEKWLYEAQQLVCYVSAHFYDAASGMFFYTSDLDPALVARKMEITDTVMPSSNSVMAKNLFILGHYFYDADLREMAQRMLNNVKKNVLETGPYYANWDILMGWIAGGLFEIAIAGDDCLLRRKEFDQTYLPNVLLCGAGKESRLELLKDKIKPGRTIIYVCTDRLCKLPVDEVNEAIKQVL